MRSVMSKENIRKKLMHAYKTLHKEYGPQGWWPVTDSGVVPTYKKRKRLSESQMFEIIVGAILAQNTSWKNAEKSLVELNKENAIDAKKLVGMNKNKLIRLIKSSGYFNQKADRLKVVANFFLQNKLSDLSKLEASELRNKLLEVKGIGEETADSIVLYAFKKPMLVIDAYTKRIMSRLGMCKEDASYGELQEMFHSQLEMDAEIFNEYHALLVELAKQHCTKKPVCTGCPAGKMCQYAKYINL